MAFASLHVEVVPFEALSHVHVRLSQGLSILGVLKWWLIDQIQPPVLHVWPLVSFKINRNI